MRQVGTFEKKIDFKILIFLSQKPLNMFFIHMQISSVPDCCFLQKNECCEVKAKKSKPLYDNFPF